MFLVRSGVQIIMVQSYWIEALSLRALSAQDATDEEFIQKIIEVLE
jgi:hypothetical protein